MKRMFLLGALLAVATTAHAAPNVANATQKGSLLLFPDINILPGFNTLVRIQNDGSQDVDVKCYWMDGNKNRVDFIIPVTKNQPVWFDARTGQGTYHVNRFPQSAANGFDNPFLPGGAGPFPRGLLVCWAVDGGSQNQVKWNHLSGTATVYDGALGAFEYNAYAFAVPTGLDLQPVGVAGTLNLNGVEYDSCPQYQIGQFTPSPQIVANAPGALLNSLAVAGCMLDLKQDWQPVWTKLQFDVWNEEEVKFTGAFECADSWHTTDFGIDSAIQNFNPQNLGTYAARYRVQGVKSTQCEGGNPARVTQAVGVLAVQSTILVTPTRYVGTTLTAAGKFTGKISWDPSGAVPEGGIR